MPTSEPGTTDQHPAVEHLTGAQELLKSLQKKVGEHPELAEAIRKLESALNILTVKTGGIF
jgi:hypothetical protein